MLDDHDYVMGLPPHEPSGRGRDELFGNATEPTVYHDEPLPPRAPRMPMVGICRTCGKTISANQFFNTGKCFGC